MSTWATIGQRLGAGTLARVSVLGLIAMLLASCGSSPSGPSPQGSVRLTTSITDNVIPAGQTAILTFRLENGTPATVTLNFNDSCQLNPYIQAASGQTVYPPGGGWFCAQMLTSVTLRPGESKTRQLRVGGYGQAFDAYAPLPAGEYSAFAKVPSKEYNLQSDPVRFAVR